MRILVVDHVGGVETFRDRYRALATLPGVELTVFVPETWIEAGKIVRAAPEQGPYRVLTGRAGFRGYENRGFFYSGVWRALRETRPDILHLMEEPFSVIALEWVLAARRACPRAEIVFYTADNLRTGFRYPYRPSWFYGRVQRFVQKRSACGMVISSEARTVLESRGFTGPIRHVPLGVDPERFRRRDASPERARMGLREHVIGFAGRLIPAKGIDTLLGALALLRTDWSLVVVGGGPAAPAIEARAAREGWSGRLRIETNVSHADVPARMNLMDVLVLPSRTMPGSKEQFGRVLIEAMACEVPVIGSDTGGIPEVIGEAGVVVPEGDPGALARALNDLHGDPARRDRLAAAGRARVLRHFTWRRIAEMCKSIYDGILDGTLRSEEAPEWSTRFSSHPPA